MNIEEVSIYESIVKAKGYITHVHLADSNRWAPGSGHLDFAEIIKTLEKINYQGYVSAEILPLPDPNRAAPLTIEHLKKIIATDINKSGRPTVIIAHTIKGKGVPWMEFNSEWHTHPPNEEQTRDALENLKRAYERGKK